ncbi:NADH-quinone oxidoreductase subunit NuoN [Acinetobacter shaoyimingii]|uniref:NADH-quinone oxidoreductase subunit N n=1 Tax=Acinetobacter shaoyimingii TaxID=2715164 RepID=A0A6G8RXP2_9GAMM|nr:NADH-quinone oxidoreductase subunit NuoN [Acinetobacter shaoyimingii]NHB57576.1 NADH-quinone oxidoreductase subunit NuoN [Acinetobacter shaoyimingii]QIO06716.1 NADH-quinone oxidoreductase subunit NuoN [Acinetobacter shaoyimingii]
MNFTVSFAELMPLAPVMIVALTAVVVMLLIAIKRNHNLIATVSVIGLNLALANILLTMFSGGLKPATVMNLFMVDPFGLFYQLVILIAALACCTLSHAYIDSYKDNREELYLLMLVSVMGAMLMVVSSHLASFFISLELMSIPVYGLIAYTYQRSKSLEAGVKYLVLSATASAMLLMGMAYVYAVMGSLSFAGQVDDMFWALTKTQDPQLMMQLQTYVPQMGDKFSSVYGILGLGLMVAAVAFKLSLAPFHKWTPDVYAGAPAPIATFLATVAKVAMIGLFVRYLLSSGVIGVESIKTIITVIAVLSIIVGNLLAVKQVNLKRILAYSSIAHFGYLLLGLVSASFLSLTSIGVYVATYTLTTIGAFGSIALMSSPYNNSNEAESLADYRGLFWRRPVLTATLTVMMLSLAGIPLTAGFIGKFLLVMTVVSEAHWFYAAMIIIGSGIGLYYYLRVMIVMYMTPPDVPRIDADKHWGQKVGGIMVLLAALAVLVVGVYPDPLIAIANQSQLVAPLHIVLQ